MTKGRGGPPTMCAVVFAGLLLIGLPVQGQDPLNVLSDVAAEVKESSNDLIPKSVDDASRALTSDYNSVKFMLFNRANREAGTEITANPDSLRRFINPDIPTKIVVHGFTNSYRSEVPTVIKDEYLNRADYNIILVDWSLLATAPFYVSARIHVIGVAKRIAQLLDALADSEICAPKDQHLIGHSLGAHVVGLASAGAKTKVGRCTGLDPAGPLFRTTTERSQIDASDADLVDIIHTSAPFLGLQEPLGKVDFYPNGGVPTQPGCGLDVATMCSHVISARYFAYTINHPDAFIGFRCQTPGITNGDCPQSTQKATMGDQVRFDAPGMYYLQAELPPEFLH